MKLHTPKHGEAVCSKPLHRKTNNQARKWQQSELSNLHTANTSSSQSPVTECCNIFSAARLQTCTWALQHSVSQAELVPRTKSCLSPRVPDLPCVLAWSVPLRPCVQMIQRWTCAR